MLRALRIGVLLLVLATVAQWAWLDRKRVVEWKETLRVVVYPVDGDGSPQTGAYLQSLDAAAFLPIDAYMAAQAKEYGLKLASPVQMRLRPRVASLPPPSPAAGAGMFASIANIVNPISLAKNSINRWFICEISREPCVASPSATIRASPII